MHPPGNFIDCGFHFSLQSKLISLLFSGRAGYGHSVPGQVWYGKNCRVCSGYSPADRASGWTGRAIVFTYSDWVCNKTFLKGFCVGDVSHQRAGLPDQ